MREWVCINGMLRPAEEAKISVFDAGFLQGIGLFETMRAYHGRVFRLEQHLQRLIASANHFGWSVVPTLDELMNHVDQVVQATAADDARVRLTVTTGSLQYASTAGDTPPLTIVASATPGGRYPDEYYQNGVTVAISDIRQNPTDPTVGHKTTSYFARLAALRLAHAKGAIEALWFTPDHILAEGSISSVFLVKGDVLRTPSLDTPILPGIARAVVLELAPQCDLAVEEGRLTIEDLLGADEVFLTNSMMEVMPVVRVERRAIANEKIGDSARELAIAYGRQIDKEIGAE